MFIIGFALGCLVVAILWAGWVYRDQVTPDTLKPETDENQHGSTESRSD